VSTFFVAIASAAATTLVIEYALRPSLDFRKKRLLAARGYREDLSSHVLTILATCGRLTEFRIAINEPAFKLIEADRGRWRKKLNESTEWLIDNVELYALTYIHLGGYRALLARYGAAARAVWLSPRSEVDKVALLTEMTEHVQGIFFTYWWARLPRLASHKAALEALLDKLEGRDVPLPPLPHPEASET
jgi:hypothetical protein